MLPALLAFGVLVALIVLAAKDRERLRGLLALDAERRAHELTRGELDGLRAALDRVVGEREKLETELAELRSLGQGGPFR